MSTMITVGKLRYDPNKVLGRGSFGTVFSGFHVFSNGSIFRPSKSTPVAVKRVEKDIMKEPIFRKEEELMKKASNHPNILKYIHTEINAEFLFIATELCSGTLDDYVIGNKYQGPRFSKETEILRQVTRGLSHLHKLGIVHRDIRPKNILIFVSPPSEGTESKPQIKLADFDISKLLKTDMNDFTNTSLTNPSGSRGWMAPEVYQFNRFDFKVDVWALGLIFAYTLSGGKHAYGDDPDLCTVRIKQNEPMVLTEAHLMGTSNKSRAFTLIKSMLTVEANDRPTVIDVLKDSFFGDVDKTDLFLDVCKSFFRNSNVTNDEIAQFQKLVNDETVDVNATTITKDGEEMSPLHLACRYYRKEGLIELVKELLFNGADVNSTANKTHWLWDHFIKGMTPLHLLFYENKNEISNMIDIVRLLLTNNAEVNAKDYDGNTPLHYLGRYYRMDNLKDIIQLLVENGANVNAKDAFKYTPLHYFFFYGINANLKDSVQLLLTSGADVNAKDMYGNTPLHELFRSYPNYNNFKDIAQLFVETGADFNVKNFQGETPLHYLCECSYKWTSEWNESDLKSFVLFLVEKGANINMKNKDGETPSDLLRKKGVDL